MSSDLGKAFGESGAMSSMSNTINYMEAMRHAQYQQQRYAEQMALQQVTYGSIFMKPELTPNLIEPKPKPNKLLLLEEEELT